MSTRFYEAARILVFLVIGIPIAVIDVRIKRIPNLLNIGLWVGLVGVDVIEGQSFHLYESLGATLLSLGVFTSIRLITKGLGLGDVKLSASIGYFCGLEGLPSAFLISGLGGLLYYLGSACIDHGDSQKKIPFAPFLLAGGLGSEILPLMVLVGS